MANDEPAPCAPRLRQNNTNRADGEEIKFGTKPKVRFPNATIRAPKTKTGIRPKREARYPERSAATIWLAEKEDMTKATPDRSTPKSGAKNGKNGAMMALPRLQDNNKKHERPT